jgi:hypothetical protein
MKGKLVKKGSGKATGMKGRLVNKATPLPRRINPRRVA